MALIKCKECSREISDKASLCPNCGIPVANIDLGDNTYTGIKVISFCFPLIGLIIYALNIGKNNELAKIASKWSIRGMIAYAIITFISFIIYLLLQPTTTTISGTTR